MMHISGRYDAVVVSGGMGEGHIPCVGLHELARLTKPGKMRTTCPILELQPRN